MSISIRAFAASQADEVACVWHRAGLAAYPYLPAFQALDQSEACRVFAAVIVPGNDLWVAMQDEVVVGFLAINTGYIDRLYVDPAQQQKGVGTQLLNFAKAQYPERLTLHTHQENLVARALYEREGFRAVAFGLSPAPENVPDVCYEWRPEAGRA